MTTAKKIRPENPGPTFVTMDQLAAEILPGVKPPKGHRSGYYLKRNVLAILAGMVQNSGDLVLSEEFVCRFLTAWNRSIKRSAIVKVLGMLASIRDFAADRNYLPRYENGRSVTVPPEWDEDNPRFSRGGWVAVSNHGSRPTELTWDELRLLVAHLKNCSRKWPEARLFVLVSLVVLGQLSPRSRAATLRWSDVDSTGPGPGIRIGPMAEILDRWSSWAGSDYVVPNQRCSGPWDISTSQTTSSTPNAELSRACVEIKIPIVRLADLKRLGDRHLRQLADHRNSPFLLQPDDGLLTPHSASIEQAREIALGHYLSSQESCRRTINKVFRVIGTMQDVTETRDFEKPDFADNFAIVAGIDDPYRRPLNPLVGHLHTVMNILFTHGLIRSNPFGGKPGFLLSLREARRSRGRPRGPSSHRSPLPRRCPIKLEGEGKPIIIDGKQKIPDMNGDAYKMLERLVQGFQQGRKIPFSELEALSHTERVRPLKDALDRPGFKTLRDRIRETKEGRNKYLEIVDINSSL